MIPCSRHQQLEKTQTNLQVETQLNKVESQESNLASGRRVVRLSHVGRLLAHGWHMLDETCRMVGQEVAKPHRCISDAETLSVA